MCVVYKCSSVSLKCDHNLAKVALGTLHIWDSFLLFCVWKEDKVWRTIILDYALSVHFLLFEYIFRLSMRHFSRRTVCDTDLIFTLPRSYTLDLVTLFNKLTEFQKNPACHFISKFKFCVSRSSFLIQPFLSISIYIIFQVAFYFLPYSLSF